MERETRGGTPRPRPPNGEDPGDASGRSAAQDTSHCRTDRGRHQGNPAGGRDHAPSGNRNRSGAVAGRGLCLRAPRMTVRAACHPSEPFGVCNLRLSTHSGNHCGGRAMQPPADLCGNAAASKLHAANDQHDANGPTAHRASCNEEIAPKPAEQMARPGNRRALRCCDLYRHGCA
jgi:hypothetical protein